MPKSSKRKSMNSKKGRGKRVCWKGWKRVPGTKRYSPGSCKKK